MTEQCISIERMEEAINLFGLFDENIRIVAEQHVNFAGHLHPLGGQSGGNGGADEGTGFLGVRPLHLSGDGDLVLVSHGSSSSPACRRPYPCPWGAGWRDSSRHRP